MYAAAAVTEIWIERQLHEQPKRSIITRAFYRMKIVRKKFQWLL